MTEDLEQLLHSLKFKCLPRILDRELAWAEEHRPSYTDFLARIFRQEFHEQQARYLEGRIKRAKIPEQWSLSSFPWDDQPGVDKTQALQLGHLDFLSHAANIVFVGPTGVGKTGLATGILLRALEAGHRGLFIKAQELFDDMYQSLADRSSRRLLNRLARMDLLVIDEMGYLNLRPEQSNMFFKLMEERYRRHSTIITTNLDYDEWYAFLGSKPMVAALLDRLRHHCYTICIDGPSLREPVLQE